MLVRIESEQETRGTYAIDSTRAERSSLVRHLRRWGPMVITALVVPGGIIIAVMLLIRRWNQRREPLTLPIGIGSRARA